ncbi:hypothetical protein V3C99_009266 [Haemonchus contortus]
MTAYDMNPNIERLLLESDIEEEADEGVDDDSQEHLVAPIDDDSFDEDEVGGAYDEQWCDDVQKHDRWTALADEYDMECSASSDCVEPVDFYKLFLNDDILGLIVEETNRYASKNKSQTWSPTSKEEIMNFIALLLQMEVVQLPTLGSYWDNDRVYGSHRIGRSVMSIERFEKLIKNFHLVDNGPADKVGRLDKITRFLDLFNEVCQRMCCPGKEVYIEELLIPVRARFVLKLFYPNDWHRYGIKMIKVIAKGGYTYRTVIHAGEKSQTPTDTIVGLLDDLLNCGRIAVTDQHATSLDLAQELLRRGTDLLGVVGPNRYGLPVTISISFLKKGYIEAKQNADGITILKWRNKTDVIMLSTKHDDSITKEGVPIAVKDYNLVKSYANLAHRPYTPYVRKTTKWYVRVVLHLLTHVAMVNAWKLYSDHTGIPIDLMSFKILVTRTLLPKPKPADPTRRLVEMTGAKRATVRRCVGCYKRLSADFGTFEARQRARRVHTRCSKCHKHFCLACFQTGHKEC